MPYSELKRVGIAECESVANSSRQRCERERANRERKGERERRAGEGIEMKRVGVRGEGEAEEEGGKGSSTLPNMILKAYPLTTAVPTSGNSGQHRD